MTSLAVTTAADVVDPHDGMLSLREAVQQANATASADTILFAKALEGQTLVLTQGQLTVTHDLAIDGGYAHGGPGVTLSGGDASRVLAITGTGTEVALADLGVVHGHVAGRGGGIFLAGSNGLELRHCEIADNHVDLASQGVEGGGGIFAGLGSRLHLVGTTVRDNIAASSDGGGIFAVGRCELTIESSRLMSNEAQQEADFRGFIDGGVGGAVFAGGGSHLMLMDSQFRANAAGEGGSVAAHGSSVTVRGCYLAGNEAGTSYAGDGGALSLLRGSLSIDASAFVGNQATYGGAVSLRGTDATITRSTFSGNHAAVGSAFDGEAIPAAGGAIEASAYHGGSLDLRACTIIGSLAEGNYRNGPGTGGGIAADVPLHLASTIVAGNFITLQSGERVADDIAGRLTASDGHNAFGTQVAGSVLGDALDVATERLFAAIDPATHGGQLALNGGPTPTVALRDALDNPALSGADPLTAGGTDQRGVARPAPEASNPDIGAFELDQHHLSTSPSAHNDVLTGTARADTLLALAGNDLVRGLGGDDDLRGLAGSDTLLGGDGGDRLDGGSGRDLLLGEAGNDLLLGGFNDDALFAGTGNDLLRGQGGADLLAGGAGRDLFAFAPHDSGVGEGRRDVILDLTPGADRIDLTAIDADAGRAGNQAFTFIGEAALTGAGQLRFGFEGDHTVIQASTDAAAAPKLEIELAGHVALHAGDFLL